MGENSYGKIFTIVKGTRLTKSNMKSGSINFVGATAFNNGVTAKIGNTEHLHPACTITVCYNGSIGQSFYQTEPYWASDDVNVLYPKFQLTKNIAFFLIPIIYKLGQKYLYTDKWTYEKMKKTLIPIPVDRGKEPNWNYMENFISLLYSKVKLNLCSLYDRSKIESNPINRHNHLPNDDLFVINNWQKFQIKKLFVARNTGNILSRDVVDGSGDTPYVTASAYNNGVVAHIDASAYKLIPGHCILVGGKTFTMTYQKDSFVSNDSHNFEIHLINNIYSDKVYFFLITAIRASLRKKYEWSDAVTKEKLLDDYIYLPIISKDVPDWNYMEEYINKITNKTKQTLTYLTKVLNY